MEDLEILENMKEVLKKTQKSKHKKPHKVKATEENEIELSEILNEKWVFSSPPGSVQLKKEKKDSPKINAFEMMMAKKIEPLSQISPEVNGVKKKRRNNRRSKLSKAQDDSCYNSDQSVIDEDSTVNGKFNSSAKKNSIRKKKGKDKTEDDKSLDKSTRKRFRSSDTPTVNGANKKRKTKGVALFDPNENLIEPTINAEEEAEVLTPTYQSGRPRRSCAGLISYELLISPEKKSERDEKATPKRTARAKKEDEIETFVVDDFSPVKNQKPVKLAPLFVKKLPKPCIDPVVREARRTFLLSGLPEEMRASIDKQKHFEEEILSNELIAFPSISHVTQLRADELVDITKCLWQKSKVAIRSDDEDEQISTPRVLRTGAFTDCRVGEVVPLTSDEISPIEMQPIENVKECVKAMKKAFDQFPTNRCFKQLYWKSMKAKDNEADSDYQSGTESVSSTGNFLFVDIFKPQTLEEFVVNSKPVKELQKFLQTWNEKADNSDTDDSSSWQSSKANNNFTVLTGSHGSGKTSSVYAIAKELNFQVIEINAGARRSGKKMLQDLLEATQSHRVKDKSVKLLGEAENSQESNCETSHGAKSIILIEDAELVFDADDGFVSTLQQLINISKRPVVLTTNNRNCQHLQKFIRHNEILYQKPKSTNQVGKYLSLLCLAANYQISSEEMERLYTLNGHDLRKTINEIEFFIRSGNSRTSWDSIGFATRPRNEWTDIDYSNKSISEVKLQSSIVSSFAAMADRRADDCEASYQQRSLTEEMEAFFIERSANRRRDLAHGKGKIESSIGDDFASQSSYLRTGSTIATDYSPMLRAICRAEKSRCEGGRRTTNNRGHYLRFLITHSSFGNDYFNGQCEMFQQ